MRSLVVVVLACACVRPPCEIGIGLYRHMSLQDAWSTAITTTAERYGIAYISPNTATVVTRPVPIDGKRQGIYALSLLQIPCFWKHAHAPCRVPRFRIAVVSMMTESGHVVSGWDAPDDVRMIGVQLACTINAAINGDDDVRWCHRRDGPGSWR